MQSSGHRRVRRRVFSAPAVASPALLPPAESAAHVASAWSVRARTIASLPSRCSSCLRAGSVDFAPMTPPDPVPLPLGLPFPANQGTPSSANPFLLPIQHPQWAIASDSSRATRVLDTPMRTFWRLLPGHLTAQRQTLDMGCGDTQRPMCITGQSVLAPKFLENPCS